MERRAMSPRLYLAVDTCFASKRWTAPHEWMRILADAGITCAEASADTEIDPLYSTPEVIQDWIEAARAASQETGVRVVNLFSGHGSYATLGLAHTDERIRDHIQHNWIEPMLRYAAQMGAGLGFYTHAFAQSVLFSSRLYRQYEADLYGRLAEIACYGVDVGAEETSVEQMYAPHQIPFTIKGAEKLLREVYTQAGTPMYLTLDTGHMVGQRNFLRPTEKELRAFYKALRFHGTRPLPEPYVGPAELVDAMAADEVNEDRPVSYLKARPYFFAEPEDGDLYAWLRRVGAYSNVIHLQQTDGTASAHHPFTERYNATGIVHPQQVLNALRESCAQPPADGMPPPCETIYLTFEIFPPTAQRPQDIIRDLRESVAYWRQYLPRDGMTLDEV